MLRSPGRADLPLVPDATTSWQNRNGSIVFAGWQATSPVPGVGSHWHGDGAGLTAFAGHLWPRTGLWHPSEPWAAQLAAKLRRDGVPGSYEDFFGVYTAAHLTDEDRGFVFSDPFGVGLLFYGERRDLFVVSNRASIAARVLAGPRKVPSRDILGVCWTSFFGYVVGDDTAFQGVKAVPRGAFVAFDGRGNASVHRTVRAWEVGSQRDIGQTGEDLAFEELTANVGSLAKIPSSQRTVGLSGGKDSRLILALLLAAGVADRFEFETDGFDRSPDVVVARELAQRFGLHHRVQPLSQVELTPEEYLERVRVHTHHHSGMLGSWDLGGGTGRLRDRLHVGGMFGEVLRSHYGRETAPEDEQQARAVFRDGLPFDAAGILRPDAKRYYIDHVSAWVSQQLDDGAKPRDLLDLFYLQHRVRRWVGALQELNTNMLVHPLQSQTAIRWAFEAGHRARRIDDPHFRLMQRASEPLTKMRFAQDGWSEENYAGLPDADVYRAIEPCVPEPGAPHPRGQWAMYPTVRTCLREYLLANPSHPIFDVIDAERLREAVKTAGHLGTPGKVAIYATLGSAVWLARDENPVPVNQEQVGPPARPLLVVIRARRTRRNKLGRLFRHTPARRLLRLARRASTKRDRA